MALPEFGVMGPLCRFTFKPLVSSLKIPEERLFLAQQIVVRLK